MLTSIICASLLCLPVQGERVEYKFKSNLARFRSLQWDQIYGKDTGLQIADSPNGKPTGDWIYFDMAGNKIIIGGPGKNPTHLVEFLQNFDVEPKTVRLKFVLSQPAKGFEMKGTLEPLSNQPVSITSAETDAMVTMRPRINDDGSVSVSFELKVGTEARSIAARVRSGERIILDRGRLMMGAHAGKSSDEGSPFDTKYKIWEGFRIDVVTEILDSK